MVAGVDDCLGDPGLFSFVFPCKFFRHKREMTIVLFSEKSMASVVGNVRMLTFVNFTPISGLNISRERT